MCHYIVRVYRREKQKDQADRLYGVVETTENGEMSVFRSFDALWSILSSAESVASDIIGEKEWNDQQEKRRYPRFSYSCSVSYRVRGDSSEETEDGSRSGKLINISRGGMSMEAEGPVLKKGDLLELEIPMAGPPISFPSLTRVVRVEASWSGKSLVGLQFIV